MNLQHVCHKKKYYWLEKNKPFSSISSNCGLAANRPPRFFVGVEGVDGDLASSASTDSLRLNRVTGI